MKDDAVSDVIGSILLVGITVGMMVGLSLLVLNFPAPIPEPDAQLALGLGPGAGAWGTGDEVIELRHLGGGPVKSIRIALDMDGASLVLDPADQGFGDGTFSIGETWKTTTNIPDGALVRANIIDLDARVLLARAEITASGVSLVTPPPTQHIDNQGQISMLAGNAADTANLAADDGALATFTETPGTTTPIILRISPASITNAVSVGTPSNALSSDNLRADMDAASDVLGVGGFVMPVYESIDQVRLGIEGSKSGGAADDSRLSYLVSGGPGVTTGTVSIDKGDDQTKYVDVTADLVWDDAAINALEVHVQRLSGMQTLRVDELFVEVTYTPPASRSLLAQIDFSDVQSIAGTYQLQLEYEVTLDSFSVQVYDWNTASYSTRGAALTAATQTTWSYTLSADEVDLGSTAVRMRIVDSDGDVGPGTVRMDYARVVST